MSDKRLGTASGKQPEDDSSNSEFYEELIPYLKNIIRPQVGTKEDAEDLALEAAVIFDKKYDPKEIQNWRGLACEIARREVWAYHRQVKREAKINSEMVILAKTQNQSVEAMVEKLHDTERVLAVAKQLLPAADIAMLGLYIAGYSDSEIKGILHLRVTVKTIRNRRAEALKVLRSILK